MDKKTLTLIGIIGAVIVILVCIVMGMEIGSKSKSTNENSNQSGESTSVASQNLSSNEIMRINDKVYSKEEFINFVKYKLYKNNGDMSVDQEQYATDIENGATEESLFINDTLNSFYQMKVYSILAAQKNIVVSGDNLTEIENDYNENESDITKYGISKDDYIEIAKEQKVIELVTGNPTEYLELPDEIYESYIGQFSGDDAKSYTYKMLQVGYTTDTETESGEMVSGDMEEKRALIDSIVANIKNGTSFDEAAESGDTRLIFVGSGIQLARTMEEHAAGFLLEQKLGSSELTDALKKAEAGTITEVVDSGSAFLIAELEAVEDGIVGDAKYELISLLISQSANELVYSIVKDTSVNNSALTRIKIK